MVTAEQQQRRRGNRRAEATSPSATRSVGQPGFLERVLTFEAYTGFPHQEIGILAGLLHAIGLWTRGGRRPRGGGQGGVL